MESGHTVGMTNSTTTDASQFVLATEATLGVTRIAVRELERSIPFYTDVIGLDHLATDGSVARLGSGGSTVLELSQEPDAPKAGQHAGLYHVALLYPSRIELARVVARIAHQGVAIQGAADHGTHEAIYLADPDGNGLELAADRPRDQWPSPQEEYTVGPQPLNTPDLMQLIDGEDVVKRAGAGVTIGHLHLHVGSIDDALAFYCETLGFELRAQLSTAAFVSLGGYHHHLGMNIWKGSGAPPAPEGVLGLRFWTLQIPAADIAILAARLEDCAAAHERDGQAIIVRDPWNNELRIEPLAG